MDKHEEGIILDNYHKLVNETITREGITSWQELDFNIHGNKGLIWHQIVCNGSPVKIDSIKNSEELSILSSHLQFLVGQMFVYRIHIRDSSERPTYGAASLFYPKEVNYAEGMFDMLVNLSYQTCYNFWDRIGDLINPFLPTPLADRAVDFHRVINAIPVQLQTANYTWLKNYCDNEYKDMNDARRIIVHYEVPTTTEKMKHMRNISDKDAIKKMYTDKQEMADYFKQKCFEMMEGLAYCLSFLDDINSYNKVPEDPSLVFLKV